MHRILCYGDSNTWGYIPLTEKRYPPEVRWTGRLQRLLGPDYQVLEDGLSGRTTIWDDALAEYHNGKKTLLPALDSQSPVDVVVLLLGTNDLKSRMHLNAMEVAMGAEQLIQMIQGFRTAEQVRPADVLLVCPPSIREAVDQTPSQWYFSAQHCVPVSRQLPAFFRDVAQRYGCAYVAADDICEICTEDEIHFTVEGHARFAEGIAPLVRQLCAARQP